MAIVTMRDVIPWGYEVESTWGTDPMTARLPFLGDLRKASIRLSDSKEARRSVSSGYKPKGFARKARKVSFEWEMALADDNPTNSLLALALGSAPDPSTGAITLYPDTTHHNLRSFTVCGGYTWPDTDLYWKVVGCIIASLSLELIDNEVIMTGRAIGKEYSSSSTLAWAAPTESTTSLFDGYGDATLTWTNPTKSITQAVKSLKLSVENNLHESFTVAGGRYLSGLEFIGREVTCELDTERVDLGFATQYAASPSVSTAEQDLQIVLSKSSGAEYLSASLLDCQIQGDWSIDTQAEPDVFKDSVKYIAKDYSFDVKA